MTFEGVEPIRPDSTVWLQPLVELHQGLESNPVHATLGVGPDRDQAGTSQHAQVLGHTGLGDSQGPDYVTDRPLLLTEVLQDATTVLIGENLERVHVAIVA
jgi:hypothetical protein